MPREPFDDDTVSKGRTLIHLQHENGVANRDVLANNFGPRCRPLNSGKNPHGVGTPDIRTHGHPGHGIRDNGVYTGWLGFACVNGTTPIT